MSPTDAVQMSAGVATSRTATANFALEGGESLLLNIPQRGLSCVSVALTEGGVELAS